MAPGQSPVGAAAVPVCPHHPCAPSLQYTQGLFYPSETWFCSSPALSSPVWGRESSRLWGAGAAGAASLQAPTSHADAGEGPGGGGSGSRPPTRLQELAPTRCPVTPGGHRQLLGPRWPQAGQDGALSPLAPYLEAAAGARGQGGGCGGSGRARAGAGRKEPRGQPLPPAHGAGAKQPRAKANSSPDNCHY